MDRIARLVDRLAITPVQDKRKLALVLSTYPGREDQIAHAVGLDALASVRGHAAAHWRAAGYSALRQQFGFGKSAPRTATIAWPFNELYGQALETVRQRRCVPILITAWGAPATDDPLRPTDGAFHFPAQTCGNALLSRCSLNAARYAARDTDYSTTSPACRATLTWRSICGCARKGTHASGAHRRPRHA